MERELIALSHDFQGQILLTMNDENTNDETRKINIFTDVMLNYLSDLVPIPDFEVLLYKTRGMQINAYAIDEDASVLDLYVSYYSAAAPPQHLRMSEVETWINRLFNFYKRSTSGLYENLESGTEIQQLSKTIFENKFERVNLTFLTDCVIKTVDWNKTYTHDQIEIEVHVWDLGRIYRAVTSGQSREEVVVDFLKYGGPIPCLPMLNKNDYYSTYLAIIPAEYLVAIYDDFGSRLLEKNVRSFLQVRGNVNKGIRSTIKTEPHMFLAYNNGLSVVAKQVSHEQNEDGSTVLNSIADFQVVNGGQTISTLFHVYKREKINLKDITVQAKITVVTDPEQMDKLVPRISEFSNSQNKIQSADFSVNHPYHRSLEEMSRTVWTPVTSKRKIQTKWYYERARGQYLVDRNKEFTISYRRKFDVEYPKTQRFDKTDIAKYINVWNQRPYMVSRGAQKNFADFMKWIDQENIKDLSVQQFEDIIALAILYKETEKMVRKSKITAFPANVTNYALALLSYKTKKDYPLSSIWNDQEISESTMDGLMELAGLINKHINETSENVNEYCKKEKCWERLLKKDLQVSIFANG